MHQPSAFSLAVAMLSCRNCRPARERELLAQNLQRQNWSDPTGLEGPTIAIATVVYQLPFHREFLDALRQSTPWQPRGGPPIAILGPGEAEMAHQTDEYGRVDRIVEANSLFKDLIKDGNGTA